MLRHGMIAGLALMLTLTVCGQQPGSGAPQNEQGQTAQKQTGTAQTGTTDQGTKDQGKKGKRKKGQDEAGKKDGANTNGGDSGEAGAPEPNKTPTAGPNKAPTAQQNPFPEAQSQKAAQQGQEPKQGDQESGDKNAAPSAPLPQTNAPAPAKKNAASDANPFPEAESEKAQQEQQKQQSQQAAPDSGSSSSGVKGLGLPGDDRTVVPPASAQEDLRVGGFYLQSGDYKGAYDRFQAATQIDPGSAEAVWGLAESARHLGMKNVAVQNYELYLSALPDGKHARDCRKALTELGVKP